MSISEHGQSMLLFHDFYKMDHVHPSRNVLLIFRLGSSLPGLAFLASSAILYIVRIIRFFHDLEMGQVQLSSKSSDTIYLCQA